MALKFLEKAITFDLPRHEESFGTADFKFDKKIISAEAAISQWGIHTTDSDSIHMIEASIKKVDIDFDSNSVKVTRHLLFRGYWHSIIPTSSMKVVVFAWCED